MYGHTNTCSFRLGSGRLVSTQLSQQPDPLNPLLAWMAIPSRSSGSLALTCKWWPDIGAAYPVRNSRFAAAKNSNEMIASTAEIAGVWIRPVPDDQPLTNKM